MGVVCFFCKNSGQVLCVLEKQAQSEIPVHLLNYQVSIVKVKRIV